VIESFQERGLFYRHSHAPLDALLYFRFLASATSAEWGLPDVYHQRSLIHCRVDLLGDLYPWIVLPINTDQEKRTPSLTDWFSLRQSIRANTNPFGRLDRWISRSASRPDTFSSIPHHGLTIIVAGQGEGTAGITRKVGSKGEEGGE
jgi:hypothetical protein